MKTRFASALALFAAAAVGSTLLFTASTPSQAVAAPMADGGFKVDPVHSSVLFKIKHNNVAWFYGRFNNPTGTFNIDMTDPAKSAIDVSVKSEDVDSGNKKRDEHLKSADFFSAKEYPSISFKGKSFKKSGDKTIEATGDLTLHGVTKPVIVTIEHTGDGKGRDGGALAGIHATFTFKRTDFGVNYGIGQLGDEVTLMIGLEGSQ
jgi:polyisoprenoid-binding protein YceI